MKPWIPLALLAIALAAPARGDAWAPYREASVVEIVTTDDGGEARVTKVWTVVLGESAFVRTNDSQWLANIRQGSKVYFRAGDVEREVRAVEIGDESIRESVEEAFKEKYGLVQRVMSLVRITEPTVLRLDPKY